MVCFVAQQAYSQELDWEIERSFRFFRYASDEAIHRLAFDLLVHDGVERSPENIEKLVNGGSFWSRSLPPVPQRPAHWPVPWKDASTIKVQDIIVAMRQREGRALSVNALADLNRRGWASLLDVHLTAAKAGTCWNRDRRLHDNCKEHGDYVRPDHWAVRVFAKSSAPSGTCTWKVQGGVLEKAKLPKNKGQSVSAETSAPCAELVMLVPALAATGEIEGNARVVRTTAEGQAAETVISIRDVLIVGMGDSMTSGEGNPEMGASFTKSPVSEPLYLPRRTTPASWTDRWCHRSVYTWQIRTALHLALENRKRSVTLLPYGCSGAEITEGLLYAYPGVEYVKPTVPVIGHTAQIGLAYQELCAKYEAPTSFPPIPARERDEALWGSAVGNPTQILRDARRHVARCRADGSGGFRRRIDLLLLAIGVNDVGFAKWVSGALLTGVAREAAGGFIPKKSDDGNCDQACKFTERRLARMKSRFRVLRRIMDERLLKAGHMRPDHVLVAIYPNAIQNQDGNVCAPGNQGMTVTTFNRHLFEDPEATRRCEGGLNIFPGGATVGRGALSAIRKSSDLVTIDNFVRDELNRSVENFAGTGDSAFARIAAHRDRFLRRGFCASSDLASHARTPPCLSFKDINDLLIPFNCQGDQDCIRRAAESLHVPRLYEQDKPEFQNVWRPFEPGEFHAYRPRSRLFRTPNDVFVLINKNPNNQPDTQPIGPLDLTDRASSGAMHPTAEAHAIIANSAVGIARTKLNAGP
jgi:hypothetical protein